MNFSETLSVDDSTIMELQSKVTKLELENEALKRRCAVFTNCSLCVRCKLDCNSRRYEYSMEDM